MFGTTNGLRAYVPVVVRLLAGIAAAATLLLLEPSFSTGQGEESTAVAIIDGKEVPVKTGDVIAEGTTTEDGNCAVEYAVMTKPAREHRSSTIEVTSTPDCQIVVSKVVFEEHPRTDVGPPEGGTSRLVDPVVDPSFDPKSIPEAPVSKRRGVAEAFHLPWDTLVHQTQHTFKEQVGIPVTRVTARVRYDDDWHVVENGRMPFNQCWWRSLTQWQNNSCNAYWGPSGPDIMYNITLGNFSNAVFGINHSLFADTLSEPGRHHHGYCQFFGSMPPFWSDQCSTDSWLVGDADCNHIVTAVDALLVNQYVSGIISSVPCPVSADANGDGNIEAVDALLILQYVGGLIDRFP